MTITYYLMKSHYTISTAAIFLMTFLFSIIFSVPARSQDSVTADETFIEGVKYYNISDWNSAESVFLQTIQKNPDNDAAYFYLGLTYTYKKEMDKAEVYLKKAQEKDPKNFWYRIRLAQFYSETGRIEVALSLYQELVNDYPSKSSLYYEIIDLYTNDGQIDKALETLDKIESLRGENEATGSARYELLNMKGKYEEAAQFLEKYYKTYPSPRTAFVLGDIYKSKYADSTAIRYYQESLNMDPTYTPANFGLAEVYRMKRNFPLFFKNINIFLSNPQMSLPMKTEYLNEVVMNPQFIQAFLPQVDTMITNVVNAHPSDSTALFLAGSYYVRTGRIEEGKAMYRENLNYYPDDLHSNIEYISLLYYLKEWPELINQVLASLGYFPDDASLKEILGVGYWQNGEIDKAIEMYLGMIKASPKSSPALLGYYSALGDLYHEKGISKKSYSYYDKALKINSEYNPVLNNYAYYLSLEGKNLKKASQMSKKTILSEPDNPTYLDTYAWILHLMGENLEAKKHFKHAMLYGGKEDANILDHYADVLYALKEYDLAFIYWEQADKMDPSLKIGEKSAAKKSAVK